jgi:hypothetical protein
MTWNVQCVFVEGSLASLDIRLFFFFLLSSSSFYVMSTVLDVTLPSFGSCNIDETRVLLWFLLLCALPSLRLWLPFQLPNCLTERDVSRRKESCPSCVVLCELAVLVM